MRVCIPRSLPLLLDHAKSRFCSCATGVTEQSVRIQEEFMLNDLCLRVNEYDEVLGYSSKKECHRILHNTTPLHRAFSLFLFRHSPLPESGLQLLVQRRSPSKFTFPTLWSNTCCSHPIANIPHETVEENALGVKWAAARKVEHELGIRAYTYMPVSSVHFLTRIVYFALNEPPGSDQWAEHELDYILVSVLSKSIDFIEGPCIVNQNPEEVSDVLWMDRAQMKQFLQLEPLSSVDDSGPNLALHQLSRMDFTPWFRALALGGYLDRIWRWSEALCSGDRRLFLEEDSSWDRSTIIRLDS